MAPQIGTPPARASRRSATTVRLAAEELAVRAQNFPTPAFLLRELSGSTTSFRALQLAVRLGSLTRVRHGVYADALRWQALSPRERHAALVHVAARIAPDAQVAFASAAALHGLPLVDRWPDRVHVLADRASGGRSTPLLLRHCIGADPQPTAVGQIVVTDVARTICDIARTKSLADGLAAADHALREKLTTLEGLTQALRRCPSTGQSRAQRVIRLADGRAESPGESVTRAAIAELGFVLPTLQAEFVDHQGFIGRGDMHWVNERVLLEFDGRVKYTDPAMLRGRDPNDVLVEEKRREDRIRRLGIRVIRVTWEIVRDPVAFEKILTDAGIPRAAQLL